MTWNSGHVITPWLRLSWLPQRLWKVTQEAARRLCFLQVYSDNNDHLEQLCIDFHHWSPFPVKWPKGWQQNAPPADILIILYYLDFFTLCLYKYFFLSWDEEQIKKQHSTSGWTQSCTYVMQHHLSCRCTAPRCVSLSLLSIIQTEQPCCCEQSLSLLSWLPRWLETQNLSSLPVRREHP